MATPAWQPGNLYAPGSLVVPRTAPQTTWPALENPGFETGNFDGWTTVPTGSGTALVDGTRPFNGSYGARWLGQSGGPGPGGATMVEIISTVRGRVRPGQVVSVSAVIAMDDTGSSQNRGCPEVVWYDIDDNRIGHSRPPESQWVAGNYSHYVTRTWSPQAPAGAHWARMGTWLAANSSGGMRVDQCSWTSTPPPHQSGLQYRAVQPAAGYSDSTEPVWPGVVGEQVIDHEVVWEAILMSRVVWEARSILRSGLIEPDWPAESGALVADNTISWRAVSRRVEDPKCPQSKYVIIAASKVFAGDGDIARYSATGNPLDWSSRDDAGYIPFGLNMYGANPIRAMGLYRGNGVFANSQGVQLWALSEDPQEMQILDAFPVGTTYHKAMAPVSNDMQILTLLGVRSIGIAGGKINLQADDMNMPIDPLVQDALAVSEANGIEPISTYHPSTGQYLLAFPHYPPAAVSIHGDLVIAAVDVSLPPFAYLGAGGVRPYTFRLRGDSELPPGLALSADGSVTGTPTETGTFTWEVEIEDSRGGTSWLEDSAQIVLGPSIDGEAPDGITGEPYSFAYTPNPGDAEIDRTELRDTSLGAGWDWDEATATISHPDPPDGTTITLRMRTFDTNGLYADHEDEFVITQEYHLLVTGSAVGGSETPLWAHAVALEPVEWDGLDRADGADLIRPAVAAYDGERFGVVTGNASRHAVDPEGTWTVGATSANSSPKVMLAAGPDGWLVKRYGELIDGRHLYATPSLDSAFTEVTYQYNSTLARFTDGAFLIGWSYSLSSSEDLASWDEIYSTGDGSQIINFMDVIKHGGALYAIVDSVYQFENRRVQIRRSDDGGATWPAILLNMPPQTNTNRPLQLESNGTALLAYCENGYIRSLADNFAAPAHCGLAGPGVLNTVIALAVDGRKIAAVKDRFFILGYGDDSGLVVSTVSGTMFSEPSELPITDAFTIVSDFVAPEVEGG